MFKLKKSTTIFRKKININNISVKLFFYDNYYENCSYIFKYNNNH